MEPYFPLHTTVLGTVARGCRPCPVPRSGVAPRSWAESRAASSTQRTGTRGALAPRLTRVRALIDSKSSKVLKLKEISNLLRKFLHPRIRSDQLRASKNRNLILQASAERSLPGAIPHDLQKFYSRTQNALHSAATAADKHFAPRRVLAHVRRTYRGTGLAELRAWRVSHAGVGPPNQERAR